MYRKTHGVYRIHTLCGFRHPLGGLEMYLLQIRGGGLLCLLVQLLIEKLSCDGNLDGSFVQASDS